jgi:hypothetical protein
MKLLFHIEPYTLEENEEKFNCPSPEENPIQVTSKYLLLYGYL